MSIVKLKLPEVKEEAERRSRCPVCKGEIFQRWESLSKNWLAAYQTKF